MGTEVREILKKVFFILSFGFLLSVAISYKAWFGLSALPAANLFSITIPFWVFQILSGILCVLVFIQPFLFYSRLIIRLILLFLGVLFLLDFGLIQPWAWMYFVLIWGCSAFAKYYHTYKDLSPILSFLKLIVAFIYIFSGILKLNPNFELEILPYILYPITYYLWQFQEEIIQLFSIAPYVEILLGLSLLFNSINRFTKFGLIGIHVFLLLMLGPLGVNQNFVVWPFNVEMILLLLVLFPLRIQEQFLFPFWNLIFKKPFKFIIYSSIILFIVYVSGLGGNPYMAFELYSGKTTFQPVKVHKESVKQFPEFLDSYTEVLGDTIYVNYFSMQVIETNLPPCPAPICDLIYNRKIKKLLN